MNPDEAKAVVDELMLAAAVTNTVGAQLRTLFDELNGWRDKAELARTAHKGKQQRHRDREKASRLRHGYVPVTPPSRARSSSSSLREDLENGGGGDARARPLDENVSAEGLTNEVERIVKENGHWPSPRGWVRSATA